MKLVVRKNWFVSKYRYIDLKLFCDSLQRVSFTADERLKVHMVASCGTIMERAEMEWKHVTDSISQEDAWKEGRAGNEYIYRCILKYSLHPVLARTSLFSFRW